MFIKYSERQFGLSASSQDVSLKFSFLNNINDTYFQEVHQPFKCKDALATILLASYLNVKGDVYSYDINDLVDLSGKYVYLSLSVSTMQESATLAALTVPMIKQVAKWMAIDIPEIVGYTITDVEKDTSYDSDSEEDHYPPDDCEVIPFNSKYFCNIMNRTTASIILKLPIEMVANACLLHSWLLLARLTLLSGRKFTKDSEEVCDPFEFVTDIARDNTPASYDAENFLSIIEQINIKLLFTEWRKIFTEVLTGFNDQKVLEEFNNPEVSSVDSYRRIIGYMDNLEYKDLFSPRNNLLVNPNGIAVFGLCAFKYRLGKLKTLISRKETTAPFLPADFYCGDVWIINYLNLTRNAK